MRDVTAATHLRVNWQPGCGDRLHLLREWGWELVVVLDLPPDGVPPFATYGLWAEELFDLHPWIRDIEGGNEPLVGPGVHYSPSDYGLLATAAGRVLHRHARFWLAGEVWDVVRGQERAYHRIVQRIVPSVWYHGVAVHPYRDPRPWDWAARGRTRPQEWDAIRDAVGGRPLLVSEVGWALGQRWRPWSRPVDEQMQAEYLRGEVAFLEHAPDCEGVCVYAFIGDPPASPHGLMRGTDWSPRPAAVDLFRK